jgi:tetratricopeptide (TPR) repeat protein
MKKRFLFIIIILSFLILGLYFNIIYNEPTNWDDPSLIQNTSNYVFTGYNLKRIFSITSLATYQPIRDFSYVLDYNIAPGVPVLAMHIHSMILYFFMMVATWFFLLEFFRAFGVEDKKAFLWASVSAIIYTVHPVHVESVAWLYARKAPLFGLFSMISLWAFVKAKTGSGIYYTASVIFLVLAVLSQPTALVIPTVMLLIDIALQLHKPQRGYWVKRGVFFLAAFLLVVPFSIWLVKMQFSVGGIKPYHGGTFWTNILAVSQIFIEYISLYAFTVYYAADYPIKLYTSLSEWQSWLYLSLNIILIGAAVFFIIKKRYIFPLFVAWHYIFVLPVSHLFPLSQNLTDRYAFLPSLTWCVLLGYIFTWLWFKRLKDSRFSENFPALVAAGMLFIILSSYSYITVRQTMIWRNSQTLWENTIKKYPGSISGSTNLAQIYIKQGRYEDAQLVCFNSLEFAPYNYEAISNMALAQMMMKQYDNAINNFNVALKLSPDLKSAKIGLFNSYFGKGDYKNAYATYNIMLSKEDFRTSTLAPLIFSRQAVSAFRLGYMEQANSFMKKAIGSTQYYSLGFADIALAANSMGDKRLAVYSYKKLLPELKDQKEIDRVKNKISKLEADSKLK